MSLPAQTDAFICGTDPAGLAPAIGPPPKGVPYVLCDRLVEGRQTLRAADSIPARRSGW